MASDAATNAVILEVLTRHLENEPHKRAEITIKGAKHEITNSELDFLIKDSTSYLINDPSFPVKPLLAARIILTLRDTSNPEDGETELAAHIITSSLPNPDPASPSTLVILDDTHGGASQSPPGPTPPAAPHRASTIPTHPFSESSVFKRVQLADNYVRYLAAFMAPPPTPLTILPHHLHEPVTHNSRRLSVPEYHNLVETVRASIPDISESVVDLLADEERGVVAARLKFKGTLVRPFAGVEPPAEGGGLAVGIEEIVFYWFEDWKIREVVSLVDLGGMAGGKS